jgi:hypothetical protein
MFLFIGFFIYIKKPISKGALRHAPTNYTSENPYDIMETSNLLHNTHAAECR